MITRVVPRAGAHSPATVAVADAVLAPQVREDVVMESVQQRVHVHQARDGLEEPMTGQVEEWAGPKGVPRGSIGLQGWLPTSPMLGIPYDTLLWLWSSH